MESKDSFPWVRVDVLFPLFYTSMASFPLERNSIFPHSKHYQVIPFHWNLFLQKSFDPNRPLWTLPSLIRTWPLSYLSHMTPFPSFVSLAWHPLLFVRGVSPIYSPPFYGHGVPLIFARAMRRLSHFSRGHLGVSMFLPRDALPLSFIFSEATPPVSLPALTLRSTVLPWPNLLAWSFHGWIAGI